MKQEMKLLNSRPVYRAKVFEVAEEDFLLPNGKTVTRSIVKHNGSVVFIPQCEDGSVLMVRQYRPALRAAILEFPAGTLEENEAPLECAQREIAEETGYAAEQWIELGRIYPAPGLCSEVQYCYLAKGLRPHKLEGDEDELIEVKQLSISKLEEEIAHGGIIDAKSMALFTLARAKGLV
jgi:ADP-ribose pyrophosphatase